MKITKDTRFTNRRVASTSNSTHGILYADNEPIGYVIEDEHREIKVAGETRIPAGLYKLGIRKQETPLTLKYQKKHSWFKYHIELQNVPNFTGVYIHIGNTEKHTEGCQVIGNKSGIKAGEFTVAESTICFKEFYQNVYPLIESGKNIYYQIIDDDVL